jgi:hypothetical protein
MKVLGVVGSPRKGGNTDILVERVLSGAQKEGNTTNKIFLNDLNIKPCQACMSCKKTGRCAIDDPQKCVKTVFLTMSSTMVIDQLLAKTKILRQAQFLNLAQSLLEIFAVMVILGKKQNVLMPTIAQFGRENQEVRANRIQGGRMVIFGQTQSFEPMDYIGRKQKQLEERHIGFPGVAGDFAQRVIVKEFAVVFFDSGSGIVKQINPPSRHLEIGHENMINVFGIFEQSQLFGFLRIFRNGTSDYNKSVPAVPFLMNVPEEFPCLPAIVELLKPAHLRFGFECGIFLGHDDIPATYSVEESDYSLSVESRIHTEANAASGNFRGSLVQAYLQKFDGSGRRSSVARTQSSVPEFLAMRFETEERMIRSSSRLFGIVADSSPLLFAINSNDYRIQIENQAGAFVGQSPKVSSQAVVKPRQLTNRLRTQPFQKPPQSRLIRKTAQSQNLQKESIVLQNLGLVDTLQPHNNGVEQCQDQLGRMVLGLIVRIMPFQTLLDSFLEIDFLAKTMNQKHPSEVSQMASSEENLDISATFGHGTQPSHLVHFLSQEFYTAYYTLFPSKNTNLKSRNNRISRIFEVKV